MQSRFYCILSLALLASGYYFYQLGQVPQLKESNIPEEIIGEFRSWMEKYEKSYNSYDEFHYRLLIFKSAFQFVKNFQSDTMKVSLNQLADVSAEELKTYYLGGVQINTSKSQPKSELKLKSIPDSVDWRGNPAITPVQNQGQCGSCWAFAATETLSSVYALVYGKSNEFFSPQELVDCAGFYGNAGCNGGMAYQAFEYTQMNGITIDAAYPYTAKDGWCTQNVQPRYYPNSRGYVQVKEYDQDALKTAISINPTAVSIEADQQTFQFYSSGVISTGCGEYLDHAVVAVGYTSEYAIIQNSWGTNWGEQGYVKLAWATNACGFMVMPYYPVY